LTFLPFLKPNGLKWQWESLLLSLVRVSMGYAGVCVIVCFWAQNGHEKSILLLMMVGMGSVGFFRAN
jgi:hypothetical protein